MFAMYPAAVMSADLAAALCWMIDDPNHEDDVKKLMPQVPTAALDNERVAKICARQLGNYRRHADVALKILQRISINTVDSASDSIAHAATHLKGRLLARLERLVARIEAPRGAAFERYRAAALLSPPRLLKPRQPCSDQLNRSLAVMSGSTERCLLIERPHVRDLTTDDATLHDHREEEEATERDGQDVFAS